MNEDGIISGAQVPVGMAADIDDQGGEIRETDIVFDCPHCGHGLVIENGRRLLFRIIRCQSVTVDQQFFPLRLVKKVQFIRVKLHA